MGGINAPGRFLTGNWIWILAAAVLPSPSLSAQSLLDRPARLDLATVTLEEALLSLQRTSGIPIAYSPDHLPSGRRVECACIDLTVGEALHRLLAGTGLGFVASRRQVLVGPEGDLVPSPGSEPHTLRGIVLDGATGLPVPGAEVRLVGRVGERLTGTDGHFDFLSLPPGPYTISVAALGYGGAERTVPAESGLEPSVQIELERDPIPLAEQVVGPGGYGVLEAPAGEMGVTVGRGEIESIPQIGDDVFRTLKRLPGVASGDISARLSVRGDQDTEMLVLLDGLELVDPYHLRAGEGALGIVDVQTLGSIDLATGGFPAEFGGKRGALFNMHTRPPPSEGTRTTVGLSLSALSVNSQGRFADGRGQWLTSLRRGFLEYVLLVTDVEDDLSPSYWDLLTRVQYLVSESHLVAFEVLTSRDDLTWRDREGSGAWIDGNWGDTYLWGTWTASFGPRWKARTMLSAGRRARRQDGIGADISDTVLPPLESPVNDEATFVFGGMKEDLELTLSDRVVFLAGVAWRVDRGRYDYVGFRSRYDLAPDRHLRILSDTIRANLRPRETDLGAYLSAKIRVPERLTWEAGLRYDEQSHTGDRDLSPRLSVALGLPAETSLKGSWGRYHQPQSIQELQVADGEVGFHPRERGDRLAGGLESRFGGGVVGRIEGYRSVVDDRRPFCTNLSGSLNPLMETHSDRVCVDPGQGRSRGLEVFLARPTGERLTWWAGYALAVAEEEIGGRWAPGPRDQRHTVNLRGTFRGLRGWEMSASWQFHSGWPTTAQTLSRRSYLDDEGNEVGTLIQREFGPLFGERLPDYHRLDVRITRRLEFRRSLLEAYLDLFNVYNRTNSRGYTYILQTGFLGDQVTDREPGEPMIPFLPTIGLRWVF